MWLSKEAVFHRKVSQGTLPFSAIAITERLFGTGWTTIIPNIMTASTSAVDATYNFPDNLCRPTDELFPFLRYKMISGKNKMSRPREKCQPPGT
jgi:hypothetical protein